MRPLLASVGAGSTARPQPPAEPDPPCVEIDFLSVPLAQARYSSIRVVIQTGNDLFPIQLDHATVESLRFLTRTSFADDLKDFGYRVAVTDDSSTVRIYGHLDKATTYRPVVGAVLTTRGLKADQRPRLTNPPPTPVTFHFGKLADPLPEAQTYTLGVRRPDGSKVVIDVRGVAGATPHVVADLAAKAFTTAGLRAAAPKAGVVEVVGWAGPDGKVLPALGGTATAAGVRADQLPRVTGPPAPLPRAVFDLSRVPAEPGAAFAVRVRAAAAGGATFDEVIRADRRAALVRAVEAALVDADFQAWAEGDRVMLYGSVTRSARLLTLTGASVTADDLPAEARPRVELQGDLPPPPAPRP